MADIFPGFSVNSRIPLFQPSQITFAKLEVLELPFVQRVYLAAYALFSSNCGNRWMPLQPILLAQAVYTLLLEVAPILVDSEQEAWAALVSEYAKRPRSTHERCISELATLGWFEERPFGHLFVYAPTVQFEERLKNL